MHFRILVVIGDNSGCQQRLIADILDIQRTNIVALINDMVKRGWVVRGRANKRAYALHLTVAGLEKRAAALLVFEACNRDLNNLVGPDAGGLLIESLKSIVVAYKNGVKTRR